jgi:hypothetical protein
VVLVEVELVELVQVLEQLPQELLILVEVVVEGLRATELLVLVVKEL